MEKSMRTLQERGNERSRPGYARRSPCFLSGMTDPVYLFVVEVCLYPSIRPDPRRSGLLGWITWDLTSATPKLVIDDRTNLKDFKD